MVDRGFDITTIGVSVNMPPFLAGLDQMTAAETEEMMSIASVRIHVELASGRIKTYHILGGTLPNTTLCNSNCNCLWLTDELDRNPPFLYC